ncbi:MAG: ADP-ribosyltransferase [Lachnospiraceae bacterium]|nr:ADP-ribosyltransferase [Lachnospiraceae bacterium]
MNLDSFKTKVGSLLEKKDKNVEDQKEINDAVVKFSEADVHTPNFDESIQKAMETIRGGLQENYNYIAEEQKMIQEERANLGEEIQNELSKLNDAQAKLEESIGNKYGHHFQDALNACKNCIRDYESLLELMEQNSSYAAGGAVPMEAYQREKTFASELTVREQAINMLVSITPSQRAVIRDYTGLGYQPMNTALREGKLDSETGTVKQNIIELHNLLKNYHTSTEITLYRGVDSNITMVPGKRKGLDQFSDEELCGKILGDKAFVSTSLREDTAFNKPTVLVLNASAGTRGAYLGDIGTQGDEESEFLMDCGQLFKVTHVNRRNGKRYIYANVLVQPSVKKPKKYTARRF